MLDQQFAEASPIPHAIMDLGSIEVIKQFVALDLGLSIVPCYTVTQEVVTGSLCAIPVPEMPNRSIGLIQRRKGHLSLAAQEFLKLLKEAKNSFELKGLSWHENQEM